jgi:hypothetical protein
MKTILMMVVLLSALLLAACGAPATPPSVPTSPPSVPTSPPSVLATMPASPLDPGGGSSTSPAPGQDAAVANSRNDLAEQLNVDPSVITLVSVEHVDWPNGCLGVQTPGVMCTMVITPGYRVILEANGKQFEYHTNERGDVVRLATVKP